MQSRALMPPLTVSAGHLLSAPQLLDERQRSERRTFAIVGGLTFTLGPALIWLGATSGFGTVAAGIGVLALLALLMLRPVTGFFITTAAVVIIEQAGLQTPIFTDHLYVFYWPPSFAGFVERPIGILLLLTLGIVALRRFATRRTPLEGGPLFWPLLGLLACVVVGVLHGLQAGGNFKIIVLEVRPFEYLFLGYLLAYNLVEKKSHLVAFFWIVIVGAGIKALQACYLVFVIYQGHVADLNEIMAHEESFFWVALLLLVVLFALHHRHRGQLAAALVILPFLLIGLVANNRRADYVAFVVGATVAWLLVIVLKRTGRLKHLVIFGCVAALAAGYVLIFSHASGTFAEPARAIMATIHPSATDARDAASNLYRIYEDFDLKYTAKQSPVIGWGFGRPFLQPLVLPNILDLDPYYLYVPHNTIYWVMMRLGALGFFALWYLIGALVVRGCQIARSLLDPYLQLVAIYVVSVTFMEVILAYADYQLFFYRNVIYLGLLAGILMRLPKIDAAQAAQATADKATAGSGAAQDNTVATARGARPSARPVAALVKGAPR
ncbi:MAG TPA: O-antigen ligase family protein [Ktedonobacterales bacterium]|nr:O-antigen ligase family protein [Ktedonobacterales bacterium]